MPRPIHPLTPASSTDIPSRGDKPLSPHLAFVLPPPAVQASEVVKARRRSSAREENGPAFALPPPPTRSRKIIQVKPKPDGDAEPAEKPAKAPAGGKKKAPSATSAAGRKMARKTAHSLIERRRRLKMNEEFNCLKGLIPACTGEMHKLAILQASIEYTRYLQDCVAKLQARDPQNDGPPPLQTFCPTKFRDEDEERDVDMDSPAVSPTYTAQPDRPTLPSISPALIPRDGRGRQQSFSSVSSVDQRRYSYATSASASPAFGPQGQYGYYGGGSALTSPVLNPQSDVDQEATAALLMLNSDRRGRGLSVKDLLSST